MFSKMALLPDDPILKLAALYQQDTRSDKIDIGVGVFQNQAGETPVMRAVKLAEERLWQQQDSKKYLGLAGNTQFNEQMTTLVLGQDFDHSRAQALQSVAGTGALRLIAQLIAKHDSDASVWIPEPTWGNHRTIFAAAGLNVKHYPYYNPTTGLVDEAALNASLMQTQAGDVIVLHGCCHNPCGADLNPKQWQQISKIINSRGLIPVIDLAYLGFGDSLDKDAYGLRYLCANLENVLLAVSCSKNFGLYRDRAGLVICVAANQERATAVQSQLASVSRAMVSMAPDHGAAIVATILSDSELKQTWQTELADMANYIRQRRAQFQVALTQATGKDWGYLNTQKGMFSVLPLGADKVAQLREESGVYMVGAGRINFAGLKDNAAIEYVVKAVANIL